MSRHRRTQAMVDDLVRALGPGPWTPNDLIALGWTSAQVRQAVVVGRLVRPHRGVVDLPRGPDDESGFVARARAALLRAGTAAVASHTTAARLHGLWLPSRVDATIHLTWPGEPDRHDHGVRIHGSALPADHVGEAEGIAVTSLARTAVDSARGRTLRDALVVLDSSARRAALDVDPGGRRLQESSSWRIEVNAAARHRLGAVLASECAWPGTVVVRDALPSLDASSESPLESWSRGLMIESGLPLPEVAYAVQGASGRRYFSDFAWPCHRVLGEADGRAKYGLSGIDVTRALRAERRRQRDLEAAGWTVVRWDSTESPQAVTRRVAAALSARPTRTSLT